MKSLAMSRIWAVVLAFGTIALLAATVYATQSLIFIGRLVPFANPSDNPNNDVIIFEFSIPHPGATTWHYHTGEYYGVVRQGTLVEDLGCGKVMEFPTGTAYHTPAGVVHQMRNTGEKEVQTTNFQLYPHGEPMNVNVPEPTCP